MEAVLRTVKSTGALACGYVSYAPIAAQMDSGLRARAEAENPDLQNLLVAAYAYDGSAGAGNLSLYARGADYHDVVKKKLSIAGGILRARYSKRYFHVYTDTSPFPEVYCAAAAGLGVIGKNGLLITQSGSFVFLGILATDLPMAAHMQEPDSCAACDRCLKMCPTHALSPDGLDADRCLSAITQRRGALQQWEQTAVRRAGLIWGCDICQSVCPLNKNSAGPLDELRATLSSLTEEDVTMSDAEFREKYSDRAFTWRGVQPLRRNFALMSETTKALLERAGQLYDAGRAEEATALFGVCEEELPKGDPLWRVLWLGRARALRAMKDYAAAAEDLAAYGHSARTRLEQQAALHEQGICAEEAGDYAAAENLFQRELAIIEELPHAEAERAANECERGRLAVRRGDVSGGERLLLYALRSARSVKSSVCLARVNRGLAEMAYALGRRQTARKRLSRAKHSYLRAGDRRSAAEIDALRVELLGPDPAPAESPEDTLSSVSGGHHDQ